VSKKSKREKENLENQSKKKYIYIYMHVCTHIYTMRKNGPLPQWSSAAKTKPQSIMRKIIKFQETSSLGISESRNI
jgi:hypothetical protein